MNESQFEDFLAECMADLQAKQDQLEQEFGIGSFARWDHDGDVNLITFSNPDEAEVLRISTTSIGSFSTKTKTWMWAWANESLEDTDRARSSSLKHLYDLTRNRVFSDGHFECDEYLAWELAAAAVRQLNARGCYRAPMDHLWVFLSLDKPSIVSVDEQERKS